MAVDGISGIGSTSGFGVNGVSSVAPAQRRERRGSSTDVRSSDDPRAAFDVELQAMLDEGGLSGVGPGSRPASTSRTGAESPDNTGDTADIGLYSRPAAVAVPTYNAAGRLNAGKSSTEKADAASTPTVTPAVTPAITAGGNALASQPSVVPAGAESGGTDASESDEKSSEAKAFGELSTEEEEQVRELQQRDAEVRAHEQAHQATGGEHAGGASYSYQRGPDNRQYAVGGSVPIDVSPVADDPEATIQKAEKVRAAAMAPASPSGQDQQVAAKAAQLASKARAEQAEEQMNPEKDDSEVGGIGKSNKADKNDISGKAASSDKSGPAAVSEQNAASEQPGIADDSDKAPSSDKTNKAAASGITGLAASAQTAEQRGSVADSAEATARTGLVSGVGQMAATTAADMPRPTESVEAMDLNRSTDSSTGAATSPAAQATRAAFSAMNSLDSLSQTADPAASAERATGRVADRAMSRATAAYARARGESLPAPSHTGISMAV